MSEYYSYEKIPKRTKNAINARIKGIVNKYGFDEFRLTANKYINDVKKKDTLQKEIAEKEKELSELKKQK